MKGKFRFMWRATLALVLVLSLGVVMAAPVSAAGLTGVSATPINATETVETTYTIGFTTATEWGIKYVDMAFDPLFTSTVTSVEVTGIGDGSLTDDVLPDLRYTVDSAELIPAGTAITITFSSVTNPVAGTYEVTVQTLDATPAVIDEGTADVTITPAPASFEVVAGTNDIVTAGEAFSVTVTALKVDETTETGYAGDYFIDFASVAGTGTIPTFELISFTDGIGTSPANFILTVAGEAAVTITADAIEPTVAGESAEITINPAALASFTISAPPTPVVAGEDFDATNITVTALDADDNPVEDYTGTVSWSSTDESAELPADYTFVAGDNGEKIFDAADFTLKTVGEEGTQTITVTDATAGVSETSALITVNPDTASEWTVEAEPTSIRADDVNASVITATVEDEFGNVDTNYSASVTFTASLGTIVETQPTNFVSGVATATLTSTEVGTATIKVTSGSLPYVTTTVQLLEPALAEVWIDDDAGTEWYDATHLDTIQAGITAVAEGGTVNVAAGEYDETIRINKSDLTVKSISGPAVTTIKWNTSGVIVDFTGIDADPSTQHVGVVTTHNSVLDGFTVINDYAGDPGKYPVGVGFPNASGCVVKNCVITGPSIGADLHVSGVVFGASEEALAFGEGHAIGNILENSTISNCWNGFVVFGPSADGNIIRNCTVEENSNGAWIEYETKNTVVEYNNIINNTVRGIGIDEDYWDPSENISINYNNIYGNGFGIKADYQVLTTPVDATNNWWGTAVESAIKDMVSGNVDFSPWLNAPFISLEAGWNLISLPLIPDVAAIETVLAELITEDTVIQVRAYNAISGTWSIWASTGSYALNPTLTEMKDGVGFWVEMSATDILTAIGCVLPAPPETPPTYSVYTGWNLIGFKSHFPVMAVEYLGPAIAGSYTWIEQEGQWLLVAPGTIEAMYGYDAVAGRYILVQVYEDLHPGAGYWLAVNADGKIYPSGTPRNG